jgi:hypothetical protein
LKQMLHFPINLPGFISHEPKISICFIEWRYFKNGVEKESTWDITHHDWECLCNLGCQGLYILKGKRCFLLIIFKIWLLNSGAACVFKHWVFLIWSLSICC